MHSLQVFRIIASGLPRANAGIEKTIALGESEYPSTYSDDWVAITGVMLLLAKVYRCVRV